MLRRGGAATVPHAKAGTKDYPPCATVPASVGGFEAGAITRTSNPKNHARTTRFARVLRSLFACGTPRAANLAIGTPAVSPPGKPRRHLPNHHFNGSTDLASSHLLGRLHPQQCEPGGEDGDNALDQGKTCLGQLWIILDNEA